MIKVIGHKSPDTDSVCSALVYAWYLRQIGHKDARAFVCGDLNKESKFVLDKFGVETPEIIDSLSKSDQVAVVDTNNAEELPEGILECELFSIVDHHKISGNISTNSPILVNIQPLACTCTVIYQMMEQKKLKGTKEILSLILCAILSDTLKFSSPTTTNEDRRVAEEIADKLSLDIESLSSDMFSAKSDLSGMSAKDILLVDSKIFEMGEKRVRISVLETTDVGPALKMVEEIRKVSKELKREENIDQVYFLAIDILSSSSDLIASSDEEEIVAKKAFGGEFENGVMHLKGIISRKKQITPSIQKIVDGS